MDYGTFSQADTKASSKLQSYSITRAGRYEGKTGPGQTTDAKQASEPYRRRPRWQIQCLFVLITAMLHHVLLPNEDIARRVALRYHLFHTEWMALRATDLANSQIT